MQRFRPLKGREEDLPGPESPVLTAERPLFAVADGIGRLLDRIDYMKKILVSVGHGVR